MKLLTTLLMCLSLIFSSFNPFAPLTIALMGDKEQTPTAEENVEPPTEVVEVMPEDTVEDTGYKIKNFMAMDFEGYCTMDMPQSHFKVHVGSSTNVLRNLIYKDNKTRLTCSYITNIAVDADIPGYITQEVAGVDTVTNGKSEEIYGDNVTWMKVPSTEKEDGCNVYVWYTLNENKSAAFWVKAKVAPDSDGEEFYEVLTKMFNSYNYYQYGSGAIFDTPSTGYYADADFDDGTIGDTSDYRANDRAYTVFQTRGGYIEGANISANWKDLEIIIDGHKFALPCRLNDFYEAGYKVNDLSLANTDLTIFPMNRLKVKLINANGTVVTVTVINESAKDKRHIDDCNIVTILVDRKDFVNMADDIYEQYGFEEVEADKNLFITKEDIEDNNNENTDESNEEKDIEKLEVDDTEESNDETSEDGEKTSEESEDKDSEDTDTSESEDKQSEDTSEKSEDTSVESSDENSDEESNIDKQSEDTEDSNKESDTSEDNEELKESDESEDSDTSEDTEDEDDTSEEDKDTEKTEDSDEDESKDTDDEKASADKDTEIPETDGASISDELEADEDYESHQLIIAGGVTWGVYTDDAIAYFGKPGEKVNWGNGDQYRITWKSSEKRMTIVIGLLHTIQSVEISCDGYDY